MLLTEQKIYSLPALLEQRALWKQAGKQVVFTNGCFDIVHLGHIDYLEKARAAGDCLIVGLNSDASVTRLKGHTRPVVEQYARLRMMAAFAFVDAVVLFEEDTPLHLIEQILPDVLTKGDDYSIENIVGAPTVLQNGGRVSTLPLVKGYSTSLLIQKIKGIEE